MGTKPRLHCPGEKSPSVNLCPFQIAKPLSPLERPVPVVLQPQLVLFWIICFIYHLLDIWRSLCSCHSKIYQSDVIPLLPQQCNSPALYCADGPSHITLLMVVGQFHRKREIWQGISSKGTMTSYYELHEGGKKNNLATNQQRKQLRVWARNAKPQLKFSWWHFWAGNETVFSESLRKKREHRMERRGRKHESVESKLHHLHFKETLRRERIQHSKIKLTFWCNATNGIAVVNEASS